MSTLSRVVRRVRERALLLAVIANVALVPLTLTANAGDAEASEGIADCCKRSNGGENFCCDQCCIFENCDTDADCAV